MQSRFENGDLEMKLTAFHACTVISAWTKNERCDLVAKCKTLFDVAVNAYSRGVAEARPDTARYDAVFKAYSRVGDGTGAEIFLRDMLHDFCRKGNRQAKPTTGIFNMVLLSWLRSNDPDAPRHGLWKSSV